MIYTNIFLIIFAYIIGAIPTGFLVAKAKGVDIRKTGSGNIGATNIMRTLGTKFGIGVLILDFLKAFLFVTVYKNFTDTGINLVLISLFIILGNIFPIFLKFKGGKGVATSSGVFAALIPKPFLIALLFFLIITSISKYVSLGSLVGVVVLFSITVYNFIFLKNVDIWILIFVFIVLIAVFIKHRQNIGRLLAGNENRINFKKKNEK